jgi:lipopolysaccharide export system permease protein
MILGELLKIFFIALVALTGIILLAGVISEAMRSGFGPMQILACIPLLLPSLLPYTVPTTTLFATCIVYGRLSADNEILALKAAGVHIIHVVWPALLLGAATSAVTMFCFLDVIPYTGYLLRNKIVSDVEELLYQMLAKDRCIQQDKINWEIHVKDIRGRKLHDVLFRRKAPDGNGFDTICRAKEAELRVDMAHKRILVDMRHCYITQRDGGLAYVESKIWPVDIIGDFSGSTNKIRAMDMRWSELFEYDRKYTQERVDIVHKIENFQMGSIMQGGQRADEGYFANLNTELKNRESMLRNIHAEWNMRPALALGCLCFALVGCPIGIWFSKNDYLSAFITCFLPIVVVYYPLMFCMFDLSRAGHVLPWMSIYNADLLMLGVGGVLFRTLSKN